MTPTVHFDHDVTLKIKIEVSARERHRTISGVTEPIISQRVVDQVIRLREGEASILGGIQNKQEQNNWTGIPGLSSIPVLKYIFGSKDHTIQDDDIVFVVVPHIVRSQELDQANLRAIDTGAGQSIDLRYARYGRSARSPPRRSEARRDEPACHGIYSRRQRHRGRSAMLAQLRADWRRMAVQTPLPKPQSHRPIPLRKPPRLLRNRIFRQPAQRSLREPLRPPRWLRIRLRQAQLRLYLLPPVPPLRSTRPPPRRLRRHLPGSRRV